jgi:Ca2+-binding RTX toxin-like protein
MIFGGSGNDELRGEEGDDRIEGGDGLDAIFGGTGNDTMLGGPGRDSFEGNEPDPPDEEKDEVLDWEGPNMTQEPNCFSANPCPP